MYGILLYVLEESLLLFFEWNLTTNAFTRNSNLLYKYDIKFILTRELEIQKNTSPELPIIAWFLGNIKLYQMRGWLVLRVGPWFKATLSNSKTRAKAFAPACHLKFLIPYQITPDLIADQIYLMISNYCHKQRLLLLCTIGFQHSQ